MWIGKLSGSRRGASPGGSRLALVLTTRLVFYCAVRDVLTTYVHVSPSPGLTPRSSSRVNNKKMPLQ